MRQIGVRNEAKLLGGLGPCGRELCCSSFLPDFAAVSVKMAKEQNLPLNPTKISGICGRLMCCLTYEYETYQELKKDYPKIGKTVASPLGPVKVLRQNIMDGTIVVETEDKEEKIIKVADLTKKAAPVKKDKG
jgi:cell fate regulator YaaT (PSP1 superfamily)